MSKRMLADVLWDAANLYLSPTYMDRDGRDEYSCNAAIRPVTLRRVWTRAVERRINTVTAFLEQLGCDTTSGSHLARIADMNNGNDELQGVRYMWLLLAMHVAEDEGIAL